MTLSLSNITVRPGYNVSNLLMIGITCLFMVNIFRTESLPQLILLVHCKEIKMQVVWSQTKSLCKISIKWIVMCFSRYIWKYILFEIGIFCSNTFWGHLWDLLLLAPNARELIVTRQDFNLNRFSFRREVSWASNSYR